MNYLILLAAALASGGQTVTGKLFNGKNPPELTTQLLYNLIFVAACTALFAVISLFDFSFHAGTLLYSVIFGLCYFMTQFGFIMALKYGLGSISTVILQVSLIATVIYGLIFWDETLTIVMGIGIVLVIVAVVLCVMPKRVKTETEKMSVRPEKADLKKWTIFMSMAFIGNAACTIIQKVHQLEFGGRYKNMLMLFAMLIVLIISIVAYAIGRKNAPCLCVRKTLILPAVAGGLNVLINCAVMYLATRLDSGVVYPVILIGGIAVSVALSLIILKERLSGRQWLGIMLSIAAILMLVL